MVRTIMSNNHCRENKKIVMMIIEVHPVHITVEDAGHPTSSYRETAGYLSAMRKSLNI